VTSPDSPCRHIAIVDDNADVRAALSSLLRSCGYSTHAYESALALLAGPRAEGYYCIISDLQMPGMSGIELLEHLRREGDLTPLIILTAFPESALRLRALKNGAICFLSKPCDANELLRCLQHSVAADLP